MTGSMWAVLCMVMVSVAATPCVPPSWTPSTTFLVSDGPVEAATQASVANGFLGMTAFSDSLYVAGVYSGRSFVTPSHRARLVPLVSVNITTAGAQVCATALDVHNGTVLQRVRVPVASGGAAIVEMTTLAHRAHKHLLATALQVVAWEGGARAQTLVVPVVYNTGPASPDVGFKTVAPQPPMAPNATCLYGTINETEVQDGEWVGVATCATGLQQSLTLEVDASSGQGAVTPLLQVVRTTLDSEDAVAAAAADLAKYQGVAWASLAETHAAAWHRIWSSGIDVPSNATVERALATSSYYILNSVRSDWPWGGLSPGGIPVPAYDGTIFWDSLYFMMPSFFLLQPDTARASIDYRLARIDTARAKAAQYGFAGTMWPWQSAFTGVETTPYPPNIEGRYEQHISGDIVLAIKRYYYATGDVGFLQDDKRVWELIEGVAEFWWSRLTRIDNTWQILDVQPPDESAGVVNNSCYTNAVAAVAIQFAVDVGSLLGHAYPKEWETVMDEIYLPFDASLGIHLEYDGYDGETINQADVALLQYPLGWPMNKSVAFNDLAYYQAHTAMNGYFTGDSVYSIAWIALGYLDRAAFEFENAFAHQQAPFNVWKEKLEGGHDNFITGAGGFIQNVVFGYSGIRLVGPGAMTVDPSPLPSAAPARGASDPFAIRLRGLHLGATLLDFAWNATHLEIAVTSGNPLSVTPLDGSGNRTVLHPGDQAVWPVRQLTLESLPPQ